MTRVSMPDGKKFAFTVFDDTDNQTVANTAPVYALLAECGLKTTKSVWVYPPRGQYTGGSLQDAGYRDWVLRLQAQGFEIGLHNVGDGAFSRDEILDGLRSFDAVLGHYPAVHCNHVSNPDNIYWWQDRFEWPFNQLYALAFRLKRAARPRQPGHDPASPHFWGDAFKEHVRYIRNFTFNDINTLAADPRMPYRVDSKRRFSNCWFSSSDGHTVSEFRALVSRENVDRLEREGGVCIVYTHFASGFVDGSGAVDSAFEERIRYLASRDGWFVPVSTLLDYLSATHGTTEDPGWSYRLRLNLRWSLDRIAKKLKYGR